MINEPTSCSPLINERREFQQVAPINAEDAKVNAIFKEHKKFDDDQSGCARCLKFTADKCTGAAIGLALGLLATGHYMGFGLCFWIGGAYHNFATGVIVGKTFTGFSTGASIISSCVTAYRYDDNDDFT